MAAPEPLETPLHHASTSLAMVTLADDSAAGQKLLIFAGYSYYDDATRNHPTGPFATPTSALVTTGDALGSPDSHLHAYFVEIATGGAQAVTLDDNGGEAVFLAVYRFAADVEVSAFDFGAVTDASTSHPSPSVDAETDEDLLLCAIISGGSAMATYTQPAGMDLQTVDTNFPTMATASQTLTASGATGTKTWTTLASRRSALITVALKSAVAEPAEGSADVGLGLAVAVAGGRDSAGGFAAGLGLGLAFAGARPSEGSFALGLPLALTFAGSSSTTAVHRPSAGTVSVPSDGIVSVPRRAWP